MHGHEYAVPGTYEITMVVAGRCPVFGEIVGTTKGGGEKPHLKPSVLGQTVLDCEIPKIHHHYPMVDVWQVCLMPDHIHMIVRISQTLPKGKHLCIIIGAFKGRQSCLVAIRSHCFFGVSRRKPTHASLRARIQRPHPDAQWAA